MLFREGTPTNVPIKLLMLWRLFVRLLAVFEDEIEWTDGLEKRVHGG